MTVLLPFIMSRTVATATTTAGSMETFRASVSPEERNETMATAHGDDRTSSSDKTVCRHFGRGIVLLIAGGAIAGSIYVMFSCDFFRVDMTSAVEETVSISVSGMGIFSFREEIRTKDNDEPTDRGTSSAGILEVMTSRDTCLAYDGKFLKPAEWMSTMWTVSQFAALVAPCLGGMATLIVLVEWFIGKFRGSFMSPILMYVGACMVQGCTLFVFGQTDICFSTGSEANVPNDFPQVTNPTTLGDSTCRLSYGAFVCIGTSFLYYLLSVALCCLPRPEPLCRRTQTKGNRSSIKQQHDTTADDRDASATFDGGTDEESPQERAAALGQDHGSRNDSY